MVSKTQRLLDKNSFAITRGHDFVEIDGVKWATCNLGAKSPEDPGLYFRWGDEKGVYADEFGAEVGKFTVLKYDIIRKWDNCPVQALWGGKWRMPTSDEFLSLLKMHTLENNNINAILQKDGKKLYFPRGGFLGTIHNDYGRQACFWTNEIFSDECAFSINIDVRGKCNKECDYKYFGLNIRPVLGV